MTASVTLPDGRELAYEVYGDPAGDPVLSFHGGLSSRLDAAPAHQAALDLGVRLISPDRPGIGRSTFQPGRRLLDWPADVAALTEALGIDRFAVMGWSCGGPYAAACGARMSDRVTAVGLLSSAVPFELVGTTKGLARDDRLLLFLVRSAPATGLRPPPGHHRRGQRGSSLPGDPPELSRGRPGRPGGEGIDRRRRGLRQRVDAPGSAGVHPGLPRVRGPLGIRSQRGDGARPDLGGRGRRLGTSGVP